MSERTLVLEVLHGPLDGHIIQLTADAEWSQAGEGQLVFPWDTELGNPQARFTLAGEGWLLEALPAPHTTRRLSNGTPEPVSTPVLLHADDIVYASHTWLLISRST